MTRSREIICRAKKKIEASLVSPGVVYLTRRLPEDSQVHCIQMVVSRFSLLQTERSFPLSLLGTQGLRADECLEIIFTQEL